MLAMLIWRANRGPFDDMLAEDLLSMAADDPAISSWNDLGVVRLRQHVIESLRRYVWPIREWPYVPIVPGLVPRADVQHRGSPYRGRGGWVDHARCGKYVGSSTSQQWSNYCSAECRIRAVCESIFCFLGPKQGI